MLTRGPSFPFGASLYFFSALSPSPSPEHSCCASYCSVKTNWSGRPRELALWRSCTERRQYQALCMCFSPLLTGQEERLVANRKPQPHCTTQGRRFELWACSAEIYRRQESPHSGSQLGMSEFRFSMFCLYLSALINGGPTS